jgi:hypothetical protein
MSYVIPTLIAVPAARRPSQRTRTPTAPLTLEPERFLTAVRAALQAEAELAAAERAGTAGQLNPLARVQLPKFLCLWPGMPDFHVKVAIGLHSTSQRKFLLAYFRYDFLRRTLEQQDEKLSPYVRSLSNHRHSDGDSTRFSLGERMALDDDLIRAAARSEYLDDTLDVDDLVRLTDEFRKTRLRREKGQQKQQ